MLQLTNMNEGGEDRIEKLNDTLYSRTRYRNPLDKRTPVKEFESPDVEERWQTPELDDMLKRERVALVVHPWMRKVFIFALLFFVAAVIVAGFVFTGGINFVSSRNVDINILGPTSISAGKILELGVSISNANNADLEFANLSVQYPQGSRRPDNTAESLTYTRDDLGVINAGDEAVRDISVVLLGTTGEVKEIKFSVEYKVKGSSATFYKDKVFQIAIGDAPIILTVESPATVTSGDNFTTVVSITLNATEVLKNAVLKAEYPHGYSKIEAVPEPSANDNIWALGDLSPGAQKTVSIRGRLVGENDEERTFRFYVGISDNENSNPSLKVNVVSLLNTIAINRPSISLNVFFNGKNMPTYVAPAARPIAVVVKFQNNLPDKLINPRLEVGFSGAALDKSSVKIRDNGLYDPGSSKIVWNLINIIGNPELNPGEGGQVTLELASLPIMSLIGNRHDIILNLSIIGTPISTVGQEPLIINEIRTVRISSQVNFSSKVFRSLGPFASSGPIPPKAGATSTYTVIFSLVNTEGDFADAKVIAQLGPSVSWLAVQSVAGEKISYDSSSNAMLWDLGLLVSDTGFSTSAREIVFQLALTPTLGQIGTAPVLVNSIVFSGRSTDTGNVVNVSSLPLTTNLTDDPAFVQGDDIVVK